MPDGIVLAFDFGIRRTGIAIGEMMLGQARPLTVIETEQSDARFAAITKLIAQWQPTQLLVGIPSHLDGQDNEMTQRCRRFARQLEGRYRLPVVLIDERLSSVAAEETLRERGRDWRARKGAVDAEAAAILLQNHFDESRHESAATRR